jgi:succinyl-CoA synthetase alpha subunit
MTPNLLDENSQCIFYNLKGQPIQRMLDFDYLSKRKTPSVAAIVHPGRKGFHKVFFGKYEILIPIYGSIKEAIKKHPTVNNLINFASFRSAYDSSKEALDTSGIKVVTIVAEGIPQRHTRQLIALAKEKGKIIIGPATVGGIIAGKFRIGHAGGDNTNIIRAKLYQPGSVGLVSISGAMMNEMFNIISRSTDGINEGIAIGGDMYPGSTFLNHLLRYEANPDVKMIVALSELGGTFEYDIIKAKQEGKLTKPIVMWVSGTCASLFPFEVQFGHAGAKAGREKGSAEEKNKALKEAGIIVPEGFETFEEIIAETFKKHVQYEPTMETPPKMPEQKQTHFTSTITDERGNEPLYNGVPLSEIVAHNGSVGDVIGLLWLKKKVPVHFSKFLNLAIVLTADHGPAVSTAHNAIVAARAGKDVISSLISGLSTIGPRHGGAIDGASKYFKKACDSNQDPVEFVKEMKSLGMPIPGIGHRIKSIHNPDKRVSLLQSFARENFPSLKYLDYALQVEQITLKKADNLILNVDGCIGVLFLDAMASSKFSEEEMQQIVEIGYMDGLFAVSRSIGMIGHILDQKRLGERMYRHPVDDIAYIR